MLCQITFRSRPLYNSVQDRSDSSYHYKLFLKSFNLVKMDVALENFFSLHKIQPLPTVVKKKQDKCVVSSLCLLAVSAVVTQPGLLALAPPGYVRVMTRHFTGKSKTIVTLAVLYTGQSLINCVLQGQHIWSVKHVMKKQYICTKSLCCSKGGREEAFRFEKLPTTTTITRRCTVLCEIFHTEQNPESVILTNKPHIFRSINI